jgi:hypothetical protein
VARVSLEAGCATRHGLAGAVAKLISCPFQKPVDCVGFLSALVEVARFFSLRYPPVLYLWTIWAAPAWLGWVVITGQSLGRQTASFSEAEEMK